MQRTTLAILGLLLAAALAAGALVSRGVYSDQPTVDEPTKLGILWTSGDRDVALKMGFMYASVAKQNLWWEEIRIIVWGPSSPLLAEDEELQQTIAGLQTAGVEVVACKACADLYGVSERLETLGIEVRYVGGTLTEMLKGEWVVMTL